LKKDSQNVGKVIWKGDKRVRRKVFNGRVVIVSHTFATIGIGHSWEREKKRDSRRLKFAEGRTEEDK